MADTRPSPVVQMPGKGRLPSICRAEAQERRGRLWYPSWGVRINEGGWEVERAPASEMKPSGFSEFWINFKKQRLRVVN